MELSERMMVERYELGDARQDAALRPHGRTAVAVFEAVLLAVGGFLIAGAVQVYDGWAHLIVIGALVATTIGLMIAVSPNRRG